jgi:ParB family chromosome partitioning protein
MNKPELHKGRVIGFQERPLGPTIIRTFRRMADIDDLVPNDRQPRIGPKEDEELQRQIDENKGIFEPLLVEPHPDLNDKFRIIDGERRWVNSQVLISQGKSQYRQIPIEVTDRTLSEEDRLRVWIHIHRQRKEWDAREKEMVAYRLIELVGRASAANILGITSRELDKLVEVFALAERFKEGHKDIVAGIAWARELMGISKKLLTPTVIDAIVDKVARKRITNSKELRKLRKILPDPVARENFLTREGDIDSAMLRLGGVPGKEKGGLKSDLNLVVESMKRVPWTALNELKDDPELLRKIDEASSLLKSLRNTLSS